MKLNHFVFALAALPFCSVYACHEPNRAIQQDRVCEDITGLNLTDQFNAGILQQKVTLKEIDPHTLIHKAILENSAEVIRFLLKQGVSVDYPDENGMSPLTIAILNRSSHAVEVLLAHQANVNPQVKWNGMTLLELSLSMKDPNSALLLIEHGADVIAKGVLTQVMRLVQHDQNYDRRSVWKKVTELMISLGANIHASDNDDSPLFEAVYLAQNGDFSMLELLQKKGADVNMVQMFQGRPYNTPLLQAIRSNKIELIKFLVEAGADVNKSVNYDGTPRVPLKEALKYGHAEIVQYLLQHGARA